MNRGNFFRRAFIALLGIIFALNASIACAEVYEGIGKYFMIDNELDNDEIITISAGVLHVIDTKFSMTPEDEEIIVKAFVTAQIDLDELEKLLEQEIKSRMSK